jgi:pimeloyl-ACP methyl ester carboxylesterase
MAIDILPAPAGMFGASAASMRPLADALLESVTSTPGGQRLLQSLLGGGGNVGSARSDSNLVARATHELALLDLAGDLPKIAVPFTVVYATPPARRADPAATVRIYQAAYRPARNARLVPIADSGHMIMYDQPARFREAVKAFLAARG